MKKLSFLILIELVFINSAYCSYIDPVTAKTVATNYFLSSASQSKQQRVRSLASKQIQLELVHQEFDDTISRVNAEPYYYVYNVNGNNGYIIISADDAVTPVLAYSFEGQYENDNLPPAFKSWLDNYKAQIKYVKEHNLTQPIKVKSQWISNKIKASVVANSTAINEVLPLLDNEGIAWDQGCYYNSKCPSDNRVSANYCGNTPVGCDAVAMGQILRYWKYPQNSNAIPSYSDGDNYTHDSNTNTNVIIPNSNYGTIPEESATTYNWAYIQNHLTSSSSNLQKDEVSKLLKNCAKSIQMNFGPYGSESNIIMAYNSFKNYFNFPNTLNYIKKVDYINVDDWINTIKRELDNNRPVFYRGSDVSGLGGHAFVCDGYKADNYFHFNWGWDGNKNNYCTIESLVPDYTFWEKIDPSVEKYNFSTDQGAITGIMPKTDIIPISPSLSVNTVQAGSNIIASCVEDNAGVVAAGAHVISIYLSGDNVLTPGENGDIHLANIDVAGISVGACIQPPEKIIQIPANTTAGNYYVFFVSDGTNEIEEFNEDNNIVSVPLTITKQNSLATINTSSVANITSSSATCGGELIDDGGAMVTASGVCWNTTGNPTILDSHTTDGNGIGSFTSAMTNLIANTTYIVRAYATNSVGTSYGNEVNFKTSSDIQTVTDIDGNVYHTIKIGTQTWMVENLKTTKYNDGTAISLVTDNTAWAALSTPAYCWYNNNSSYKNTYGALYNWYAVNTAKLAPAGWHVSTNAEWTTLTTYLGGWNVAGGKLKEAGTLNWQSPNTGATNETGFSALPGGGRLNDGTFSDVGYLGVWWSSTEDGNTTAWGRDMGFYYSDVDQISNGKVYGFSVRCVKDTKPIVSDIDGNVYHTITIGTQTWMAENLKTTHYRNGESITNLTEDADWNGAGFGAWCDYSNLADNGTKYGHLYNRYAVVDSRNIAPTGWHVASDAEWTTLENYLITNGYNYDGTTTGNKLAKSLAATTDWNYSYNIGAIGNYLTENNSSGFSALPSGDRSPAGSIYGDFMNVRYSAFWWTSSANPNSGGYWARWLDYHFIFLGSDDYYDGRMGFSVRCVRDLSGLSIITSSASMVSTNSATSGGNVTNDGGITITGRGICWSTSPSPTIALSTKTIETGTTGAFTSSMTNLIANTTYYVRAYATNSIETVYGNEESFTTQSATAQLIIDELDGSTVGVAYGISYTQTQNGQGAVLSRTSESRIEYPFSIGLPHEGTIEMLINVRNGFSYDNYVLKDNQTYAYIFNTGPSDVWNVGAMWLGVNSNGDINLSTATVFAQPIAHTLSALGTSFRFNEWHIISFSYGSQGQYLKVDGQLVASNPNYTESLQTCSNWDNVYDVPTIGKIKSVFWQNNQYDQGFEGVLDRFRASNLQQDWMFNSSTGISEPQNLNINLYPNPTSDSFKISALNGSAILKIIDISGKELFIKQVVNNEVVSIKALSKGIYILKLVNFNVNFERKIIKN